LGRQAPNVVNVEAIEEILPIKRTHPMAIALLSYYAE
jgi:hypothetical protein